jgi:SAM-dependent methyltransferase
MAETRASHIDATYLASAAAVLAQQKRLTYDAMHLKPCHSVLDVGCGPATDTIPLAQVLGERGRVVGVDADPAMIALADQRAAESDLAGRVSHTLADVATLPFATNTFDAGRSERVFQHLVQPERTMAEMVRVTKPGGWVVVLDCDWGSFSIDSPHIDIERTLARVCAERVLPNGYSGRSLYRLFCKLGLTNVDVALLPISVTSYPLARQLSLLDPVEQDALACGDLTLADLALWLDTLECTHQRGDFFASASLVLTAGRNDRQWDA